MISKTPGFGPGFFYAEISALIFCAADNVQGRVGALLKRTETEAAHEPV